MARIVRLSPGRYHSFTVRIWSKGAAGELTHGEVTDVATRRSAQFRDARGLLAFILRTLGARDDQDAALVEAPSTDSHPPLRDAD
jgi:hypothetical protein